LCYGDPPNLT